MKVLVGCERSGVVREAFRRRGHDAWSCDTEPAEDDSPYHIKDDVLLHLNGWDMGIFHPPCTFICVTGNKWFNPEYKHRFPDRRERRAEAIKFFMSIARAPILRLVIENPVGIMSRLWREPDQIIQPFWFGHPEPKKTCLWLKNVPPLTPTEMVEPDYHVTVHSNKRVPRWFFIPSPSNERHLGRSRTFPKVAEAMAEQWSKPCWIQTELFAA